MRRLIAECRREFTKADHLVYITYPLVKETKLLISAVESLYKSVQYLLMALAEQEQMQNINNIAFMNRLKEKYDVQKQDLDMIKELDMLVKLKMDAGFAFVKRDKFIFSTQDYRTVTLDVKKVKGYLAGVKSLINRMEVKVCGQ